MKAELVLQTEQIAHTTLEHFVKSEMINSSTQIYQNNVFLVIFLVLFPLVLYGLIKLHQTQKEVAMKDGSAYLWLISFIGEFISIIVVAISTMMIMTLPLATHTLKEYKKELKKNPEIIFVKHYLYNNDNE